MEINTININGTIAMINNKSGQVVAMDNEDRININKEIEIEHIKKSKELLKHRALRIVKSNYLDKWNKLVDSIDNDNPERILNTGIIVEGALECMELLTLNCNFEYVYNNLLESPIPVVAYNTPINEMQLKNIYTLVCLYHIRGKEFYEYVMNKEIESKKKKQNISNEELKKQREEIQKIKVKMYIKGNN